MIGQYDVIFIGHYMLFHVYVVLMFNIVFFSKIKKMVWDGGGGDWGSIHNLRNIVIVTLKNKFMATIVKRFFSILFFMKIRNRKLILSEVFHKRPLSVCITNLLFLYPKFTFNYLSLFFCFCLKKLMKIQFIYHNFK